MAVPLRVIVGGVDDDLARQGLDRNLPVVLQRHRHDDNISSLCSIDGGRRAGSWTKVRDETGPRGTRLSIACGPLLTTGDERLEERFVREFVAIQIVAVGVIL